jgi:arabinoxylan arabinofuranohydrolase
LVTQIFTADPNAIVYGDRVYVYTSHDIDGQDDFDMVDYHAFSSDDMVNWQDHGVIIHADSLPWATNLYAPGACAKNDKYYLYIPNSGSGIGVAVADDPGGPFVDPLGVALVTKSFPNANVPWLFDPACFVDDDGQAYLYFGGGDDGGQNARVVRLNDDMVSLKDSMATTIPTTAFFEASFMHKRDGKYYFSYSSDFSSGHGAALEYLIGDSPMSGFEYQGKLLQNGNINNGNNNHGSIIEFAGKNYVFYHSRKLQQELGVDKVNNRSIAIQELTYANDGKITTLSMSTEDSTVSQVKCLDGFAEVEAERLAQEHGIEVEGRAGETVRVAQIDDGDWVAYSQVDFREEATNLVLKVASASGGGTIDVLIDGCIAGKTGTSIGLCEVTSTGGANTFATLSCTLASTSGAHDLCLEFSDGPQFEIDSFHLE